MNGMSLHTESIVVGVIKQAVILQNYWAYFGLYPSSGMWKTKDHNVILQMALCTHTCEPACLCIRVTWMQ
jgi:hypothetical protein